MLKIQMSTNGEVIFKLVGRMEAEHVPELGNLLASEKDGARVVLDLTDLRLVDGDVVIFLRRCETDGIKLKNCPAYIREWIIRLRAEE